MIVDLSGNNKNLVIMAISVFIFALACDNNQKEGRNNLDKLVTQEGKRKFKNYTRPVLVDTAVSYNDEDGPQVKHYHINAYSEIDTANIEFYIHWYDSIVNELNGGRKSQVFFFDNKAGTPKILIPGIINDKGYEEYCFLFIKYERGALEYYWDPFEKRKQK